MLARSMPALPPPGSSRGRTAGEVINYGTAGTLDAGELAGPACAGAARLLQRDMDARPLAPRGTTPFEDDGGVIEPLGGAGVSLSTGDNFVTSPPALSSDIVDMEGYAVAKACTRAGVPFDCYKFVTDLADADAAQNWRDNVAKRGRDDADAAGRAPGALRDRGDGEGWCQVACSRAAAWPDAGTRSDGRAAGRQEAYGQAQSPASSRTRPSAVAAPMRQRLLKQH